MRQIETPRLVLRPFAESDYDDLYEFLAQLADDEFEGYPGITYESGRTQLAALLGSEDYYAVALRPAGKVIGNVCCFSRDCETKEIGYIINERYRRQGYGAEALRAVVDCAFRDGAHRGFAACDPRNVRSWRLLGSVGLRHEAHLRQDVWFRRDETGTPVWKDTYIYAILRGEWEQAERAAVRADRL